jgi:two-component system chemotaxis sensor kinase CheA
MHQLSQQIDQLAATLEGANATDLQRLADAHAQFDQLVEAVREIPDIEPSTVQSAEQLSGDGRRLLEQLILNEVTDTDTQFQKIAQTLISLHDALSGDYAAPDDTIEAAMNDVAIVPADLASTVELTSTPDPTPAPPQHAPVIPERIFSDDDLPLVQEFITEASTHLESAEQQMLVLEEDSSNADALGAIFRAFHTIKGVAGFLDLRQIQSLAHVAENLLDRARSGQTVLIGAAADMVLRSIDVMKALVGALASAVTKSTPLATIDGVDPLVVQLEAFLAGKTEPAPSIPVAAKATSAETQARAGSGESDKHTGDGTVKVATDRLDRLIDMVGELVIANSMVAQDLGVNAQTHVRLSKHLNHQQKIVRELQDLSMSLRMVQVGNVFRKMTRLVRDTARKMNKEVELVIEGQETELDRNVVEALSDPLVHMVRNSVDHGIELPEDRVQAGKPRAGRLELKAFHKGGSIHIEITDDGRGLNKDRILKKAIANGLVSENQQLTDSEIYRLIFAAGLSTAEKVTDISGRGVGMDVVRQNIEKLRGRVEIASTPGAGSTFTIRLPLTLAVIDGLVVKVGENKYILPINSIEQSLRPASEHLSTVQARGEVVNVRGSILPLVRLHGMFHVTPRTTDPTQSLVVIVHDNDRRACLLVDELLGQEQVVIKTLGEGIGQVKGISGGAVLGDGNVSLILDVPGIIESSKA